MRVSYLLPTAACLLFCMLGTAQNTVRSSPQAAAPAPSHAAALAMGSDWQRVEELPPHSKIRITKNRKKAVCFIDSVDDNQLVCSHSRLGGTASDVFPRNEVKSIKLSRQGRSAAGGAAVGAGIGIAGGALVFLVINRTLSYHTSSAKALGAGAAVGGAGFGIAGAIMGYSKDLFAGPLIYQRR